MSVESALDDRYALWHGLLVNDFGYDEVSPARPPRSHHELVVRAVRPQTAEIEPVVFDIRETWMPGTDPDLGLESDDCALMASSWNAQIVAEAPDGTGAERLDVDRSKQQHLWIHRHPFGVVNDEREPATPLKHPVAWLEHVETVIAQHYGYLD